MSYTSLSRVATGEIQGGTTAFQLPDVPATLVRFKALAGNSGNIYLGGADITVSDGVTDTTSGFELAPGDDSGWWPISNLNVLYGICSNNGDDLTYLVLR